MDEGHAHSFDIFEAEMYTMNAILINTDDREVQSSETNKESEAHFKTIVNTTVDIVAGNDPDKQ